MDQTEDRKTERRPAPGGPGIEPAWTLGAKDMVTTALGASRIWATVGDGTLNEVYWPSTGQPQVRDLDFIIADPGRDRWWNIKHRPNYQFSTPAPHVPLPRFGHEGEGWTLSFEVLPDPLRDALLIAYRLEGDGLRLYAMLTPRLGTEDRTNEGRVGEMLEARSGSHALCLQADCGFARTSAGFVGETDGLTDFESHGRMTWTWHEAEGSNIALTGELAEPEGVLALGFGTTPRAARTLAASSLMEGFPGLRRCFIAGWDDWNRTLRPPRADGRLAEQARISAMVLKIHQDCTFPGAVTASLSIPWGSTRHHLEGYHFVWPRDTVEAGLALLALDQVDEAQRMLAYLIAVQRDNGSWPQNFLPGGEEHWTSLQLDEIAFPILLAAKLQHAGAFSDHRGVDRMVRRAVGCLARHGPISRQDRWEEHRGISPFSLALQIAALVAAQTFLAPEEQEYALSLADYWNQRIEDWTFVERGPHESRCGYFVRLAPGAEGRHGAIPMPNRPGLTLRADEMVGLGFLYLARTGLRRADDPRILSTLEVAERLLRVETPCGIAYHRYNGDGFGEHEDGRPFDGTGLGRAWPLLAGERGHFEALLGRDPSPYLDSMAAMAGRGGLIPEQVWDAAPIPEFGLAPGRPTGSVMPLVWAHAEFLKLLHAIDNDPMERLPEVVDRYGGKRPVASTWHWREDCPFHSLPKGCDLLVEAAQPFSLDYDLESPHASDNRPSRASVFGLHQVRLTAEEIGTSASLRLAIRRDGPDPVSTHRITLAP